MLKEEIIVTAHLRDAAGVCALSIGLLVCSSAGAVAFADSTDASGGTSAVQRAPANTTSGTSGASTHQRGALSTIRGSLSTIRDALSNARGPSTTSNRGTVSSTAPTSVVGNGRVDVDPDGAPATVVDAQTNTSADDQGAVAGLNTDVVEAEATPGPVVDTPPSATNPPTSEPVAASVESNITPVGPAESGAPVDTVKAATSKSAAPTVTTVTNAPGQIAKTVLDPVGDAVITVARALGTASLTLVSLPGSKTPITDVITAVQIMISAVVDAVVEVARVPGDLASLFGVAPYGPRTPLIGEERAFESVERGSVNPLLVGIAAPQLTGAPAEVPLFGSVIRASNTGDAATNSLKNELTLSGLAPVPSGVTPATTSFLDHIVRSVLAPASLTALAAIAVPGIGGLLIVCAAGIRVGYRQAKAGLALRASGIARFAGPGPMGVVRSGGLIALRTRTPRLGKPHATRAVDAKSARAPRLLESVA